MTSTEALHQDIALHREEIAHTVDALAARLDVRPRIAAGLRKAALPVGGLVAALVALKLWRRHRS